jgi:hypothetical protein
MKPLHCLLPILAALSLCSCATYVTPGGRADLSTFTDPKVKKAYVARPAIKFPANIAVVRVQASGYQSESSRGYGSGAYSVVTTRDIEKEQDIETIAKLPGVAGVVTLNRLLLPSHLSSDVDIREAAAKLHADAVLVYTVDTEFSDNEILAPLTTITLGLAPNTRYKINSSAAAILMDSRTGFIYGALEEADRRAGLTIAWGSSSAIDASRQKAERAAYEKLLESFGPFWSRIYSRYR